MKKYNLVLLLLGSIFNIATAQPITATGNVKDVNGNMLRYAFVQDKQYKNGTYTDSLGNFSLQTEINAVLSVNCAGYSSALATVTGKEAISVVLHPEANVVAAANSTNAPVSNGAILQTALTDQINLSANVMPGIMQQGSILPSIHIKEATQGSRYFFKNWGHGFIINSSDSVVQDPRFLLNYDKISGSLILTQDKVSAIAIFKDKVKSFTLFDLNNQPHTFTMVPEIDGKHYVEVLASGSNYKIYKLTTTKFIASNYTTDGLASTGNDYDEYADEYSYFVIGKSGAPQKITLRKKSLKEVFSDNAAKLNQYTQTNNGDIDDGYLKELGDYMNK